jgi:hypothetical protein
MIKHPIRPGSTVLIAVRLGNYLGAGSKPWYHADLNDRNIQVMTTDIVDVRSQPLRPGDRIRWYLPNEHPSYRTGNFVDHLRNSNRCVVRDHEGKEFVVDTSIVKMENPRNPTQDELNA